MMDKLLKKIEEQLEQKVYPGASVALYRDGTWQDYYLGFSDPEKHERTKSGLIYDLASVSKVVGVGTIFILLLHSGAIQLDRPLKDYYPAFHDRRVSVRQLLTHTSGLDPYIPNRDALNAEELKQALNQLKVRENRSFHYTDVNFLLLGFLLEEYYGLSLDQIFQDKIFSVWKMRETSFGPREGAVPTVRGIKGGFVHDPKASVLGKHAGHAGLFSSICDLKLFLEHYLKDDFALNLLQNYSKEAGQTRSLAWNLDGDWLDHTGYTGTFLLFNRKSQKAAIFLSNRTYEKDEREQWIQDRNELMDLIRQEF